MSGRPSTIPHGGGRKGRDGCKCRPCMDKNNDYRRNRWRASRADPVKPDTPTWILWNCTPTRQELMEYRNA